MFREFKEVTKSEGLRGWRLEREKGDFYISKFDDHLNDDEYRFYLEKTDENIHIKKMQRVKSYKKVTKIDEKNNYSKIAMHLCSLLDNKFTLIQNA